MRNSRALRVAIAAALALGAGLRTAEYVASTSLWYDELTIVLGQPRVPIRKLVVR
jgi:hypothetical protein